MATGEVSPAHSLEESMTLEGLHRREREPADFIEFMGVIASLIRRGDEAE